MLYADSLPALDVKLTFDFRERYERRVDRDFLESADDDRSDLFGRLRPGFEVRTKSGWSALVQFQFAYDTIWSLGETSTTANRDAREAFARYQGKDGTVTLGRQRIIIGSERLVGAGEWTNVGRSFDGVRWQTKDWDLFAAAIGVSSPRPRDARLAGVTRNWRSGQTLFAYKTDKTTAGRVRVGTLSHRHNWAFGAAQADAEIALQGGKVAGMDHEAWAAHAGISKKFGKRDQVYLELNAASGGSGTDKSETFDNLYPTNHKFYGSMDLQSWRNMRELSLGWRRIVGPKTDLNIHGHWFELMNTKDAWYGAAGAPNRRSGGVFRDPTGAAGNKVGFELDVEATWRVDPKTSVQAGIGVFRPGKFIERLNVGRADRQVWGYLQVTTRL